MVSTVTSGCVFACMHFLLETSSSPVLRCVALRTWPGQKVSGSQLDFWWWMATRGLWCHEGKLLWSVGPALEAPYLCMFSASSMVSGRVFPFVSGRSKTKPPPTKAIPAAERKQEQGSQRQCRDQASAYSKFLVNSETHFMIEQWLQTSLRGLGGLEHWPGP